VKTFRDNTGIISNFKDFKRRQMKKTLARSVERRIKKVMLFQGPRFVYFASKNKKFQENGCFGIASM
jgi:hypothetical protein